MRYADVLSIPETQYIDVQSCSLKPLDAVPKRDRQYAIRLALEEIQMITELQIRFLLFKNSVLSDLLYYKKNQY